MATRALIGWTCETTPPRQTEDVQLHAAYIGLPSSLSYQTDCAQGLGYLVDEFKSTLAFLQAHLE